MYSACDSLFLITFCLPLSPLHLLSSCPFFSLPPSPSLSPTLSPPSPSLSPTLSPPSPSLPAPSPQTFKMTTSTWWSHPFQTTIKPLNIIIPSSFSQETTEAWPYMVAWCRVSMCRYPWDLPWAFNSTRVLTISCLTTKSLYEDMPIRSIFRIWSNYYYSLLYYYSKPHICNV